MAIEVIMPQLGLTMTEGTVVKWLKQPGDNVKKGDAVFEVETDKVTQEVTSLDEGILGNVLVGEGTPVPVGTVIAYLAGPGEKLEPVGKAPAAPEPAPSPTPNGREAAPAPVAASTVAAPTDWVRASPAAKKLAAKLGVDIKNVKGSGPAGRVIEEDVRRAVVSAPQPAAAPSPAAVQSAAPALGERIELKGVRKVVAERMAASFSTVPHFYLTVEVDAEKLVAFRKQAGPSIQKRHGVELTVTDLLIKAASVALREHPEANASWEAGAIRMNPSVSIGVAAAVGEGLLVPVIQGADRLSLGGIAGRRKALVEKARAGSLALSDLEGGSFTITNLGMFGIDQFQAIVNPPQATILAVGRIKDRIVAVDGAPAVRPTMFVTLSSDHRVLDGAAAARFLARLVEMLEDPFEMLLAEAAG